MVRKLPFALFILLVFVFFSGFPSRPAFAFKIPEKLTFSLEWAGITAGTAVLEVREDAGGSVRIVSTARSADWLSTFYPVNDRIESVSPKGASFQPSSFVVRLSEGRHKRHKEFVFKRDEGKAIHIDHLRKENLEFDVPEGIYDSLSSFYAVRNMELVVGKSVHVPVFDSKKVWDVEVLVLRKERIKTPAGTFDTIVIKPLMKSEGIFFKKGEVHLWLTDDEKKMPVQLKSKVAVGSITAVLTKAEF